MMIDDDGAPLVPEVTQETRERAKTTCDSTAIKEDFHALRKETPFVPLVAKEGKGKNAVLSGNDFPNTD
ncbi:MAG: hypothetical protein ABEK59_10755 [Halobacteria archaeon]